MGHILNIALPISLIVAIVFTIYSRKKNLYRRQIEKEIQEKAERKISKIKVIDKRIGNFLYRVPFIISDITKTRRKRYYNYIDRHSEEDIINIVHDIEKKFSKIDAVDSTDEEEIERWHAISVGLNFESTFSESLIYNIWRYFALRSIKSGK